MVYATLALLAVSAAIFAEAKTTRFRGFDTATGTRVAAMHHSTLKAEHLDVTLASGKTFTGHFSPKSVLRPGEEPGTRQNVGQAVTRTFASSDGEVLTCTFRYVRPASWLRSGGRGDCASDRGTKLTLAW